MASKAKSTSDNTQKKSSPKKCSVKKGDKVEWATSQGKTKGTVKKKVTKPMKIKGHAVKASKDDPQILVESNKSGEQATHKEKSLKKVKS